MTVVEETGLQSEKLYVSLHCCSLILVRRYAYENFCFVFRPDEQSTGNNLKLNDMENQNTSIRKKNDRNFDLTNSTISNQFHSLGE